jgi:hypothetical protein
MILLAMLKMSIEPIYHPYWLWEETKTNMWRNVRNREEYLAKTRRLMMRPKAFGFFMRRVAMNWPFSSEHNLSQRNQNRRAWLGQAACAYALNAPEDVVRIVWKSLPEQKQIEANSEADKSIKYWEHKQCLKSQLELMF